MCIMATAVVRLGTCTACTTWTITAELTTTLNFVCLNTEGSIISTLTREYNIPYHCIGSSPSPTTLLLHLLTVITCRHHFLLACYNNPYCLLHSHIILLSFSSALLLPIHPNSLISITREWTKVNNCYSYNQILLACSVILFSSENKVWFTWP